MSQKISLLYTKDKINLEDLPLNQIYFKEKGYTIFPLDIDESEMETITITFKKYAALQDLIKNMDSFSSNAQLILKLISQLQIKTFLLEHYSDWADIPIDYFILIVKEEKIYQESDCDSIEDIMGYFIWTDTREDIIDIEKYKSYSSCQYLFKNKNV